MRNISTALPVRCRPSLSAERIVVPAGTAASAVVGESGLPATGPDAVVVVRDPWGRLRDLGWVPGHAVAVEPVAASTVGGRAVVMRSAGHVLAQAVQRLCPTAKLGRGGEVAGDGFAYDFDVPVPFTPDFLAEVARMMTRIIAEGQRFVRREVDAATAAREFSAEPHRVRLVDLLRDNGDLVTIYDNVDPWSGARVWRDLCGGPHVLGTGDIPPVKLTYTAPVRGRGVRNPRLQRVGGVCAD